MQGIIITLMVTLFPLLTIISHKISWYKSTIKALIEAHSKMTIQLMAIESQYNYILKECINESDPSGQSIHINTLKELLEPLIKKDK
jgi:hypothetical protein